jgi:hypothetical protein
MIIYRPVAQLTTGRPGLASAFAAMALTAVLGTFWQVSKAPSAAPDKTAEPTKNTYPVAAGRPRP